MPLFVSAPKHIDTKTMLSVIERVLRHLPNPQPFRDRLMGATRVQPPSEQEKQLRDIYLAAEQELCSVNIEACPSPQALRAGIARAQGLQKFSPSSFSVLFWGGEAQLFFIFRMLILHMVARLGATLSELATLFSELGQQTPLAAVRVEKEGLNWVSLEKGFSVFPPGERGRKIAEAFTKIVHKLHQMLVKKFGEERAQLVIEEAFKQLKREFGAVPAFAAVVAALPPGVPGEAQVEFFPKERLVDELRRNMREVQSANVALTEEAHKLRKGVRALEQAQAQMQNMQQAQGEFIRVVSHQFRTPLSVIRWQAEVAAEFLSKLPKEVILPPKIFETISGINVKAVFLVEVLNRVFDMLAIDSGQMALNPRPQALWEVIEEVRKERERNAAHRQVTIVFEKAGAPLDEAVFDPAQIKKVVDILVENALQYSPQGGKVIIMLEKSKDETSQELLHCFVQDRGIGMSADDTHKLFTKFYRSTPATRKSPDGVGIALYVAKKFVEFHGGKMWAESLGLDKGSTFHFTIPIKIKPVAAR